MKKLLLFILFFTNIYCVIPNVIFVCPSPPGDSFWDKVKVYMEIAAKDLEINLQIVNPDETNRYAIKKTAIQSITTYKPEYIIFTYPSLQGKEILDFAEKNQVKSIIINMDIPEKEKVILKTPGTLYKNWIAHVYPDDELAGYMLGKSIMENAFKKFGNFKKLELIAINGSRDINVSLDRERGLYKALNEYKSIVKFNQMFYSNWEYKNAYEIAYNALKRYPNASIIWAASDDIAIASLDAARDFQKSVITGGIDWSNNGISSVLNNALTCSVGGHFFDGVIALILIKDFSNNIDITNSNIIKSKFYITDAKSAKDTQNLLKKSNIEEINFKKLSKFYNRNLKTYNFNIIDLLKKQQ